jgi:hypothetical protein
MPSFPDGVPDGCDRLRAAYPDWLIVWWGRDRLPDWPYPSGFWAIHQRRLGSRSAFGTSVSELAAAIARQDEAEAT